MEKVFYVLRYKSADRMTSPANTLASLKRNYKKIDILIPQAYVINEAGEIQKEVEPEILRFAQAHAMKIMPLVTNKSFDKQVAHQFLTDKNAQNKAIDKLISLCQQNKFYGVQLDFEMIDIKDKDNLTNFYKLVADRFHAAKMPISFAVAPVVSDKGESIFLKKIYENWEGAYDLKAIGKFADFISIMAYNQHAGGTTPGATANLAWVNQTIKYTLQYVPANKISIGIADYSTYWRTSSIKIGNAEKIAVRMSALSYENVTKLLKNNKPQLIWDDQAGVFYTFFSKNWLNEFLFIEDKKSFSTKINLVKKYKLRGFSVFDLGTEDPLIWNALASN